MSPLLHLTRRHFFSRCGLGLGSIALASLVNEAQGASLVNPMALKRPHFRPRATNLFNHAPAKLFMNTGSGQFGRPSIGAWVTYGLGSESQDLPGFVVLQSGPRGPRGGAVNWASGFLPSSYQGVPLRSQGDPILDVASPPGVDAKRQRVTID